MELTGSLLLTGSNASGKSTLIKAAALSAIMAQSLCTAPCTAYSASAFHVYTSMALSDDILAGEELFYHRAESVPPDPDGGRARGTGAVCHR